MQIRCYKCHTPFALQKPTIHAALAEITAKNHKHYNAICPNCRRANKVSKMQLKRAAPGWKPVLDNEEADNSKKET
jgi:hypothetical protein